MSGAIELIAKGDAAEKPLLYACPKCGSAHSPRIYLARDEVAHATAREAAENCYNCREHNTCSECGEQCSKGRTKCEPCHKRAVFERAEKVAERSVEHCYGWGGDFYHDTDEARDAGEEWVFDSTFRPFRIDPCSVIENVLDDHFEDASEDDLKGSRELRAAIEAFNALQTSGTYDEDRKRIAVLALATPHGTGQASPVEEG